VRCAVVRSPQGLGPHPMKRGMFKFQSQVMALIRSNLWWRAAKVSRQIRLGMPHPALYLYRESATALCMMLGM
jgi:hypothetical protein